MLDKNKKNLPELNEGEIIVYEKADLDKLALALGLNPTFVANVQQGLTDLKIIGINRSILTVLKVNKAVVVLHEACINKSDYDNYKAVFKPLFIKKKTANNSIKSGFIEQFNNEEYQKFEKKYGAIIKETLKDQIAIGEADLKFPLAHLEKLASKQIDDIELIGISYNYLTVKETKGQKKVYKILLPSMPSQNVTPENFFSSEYFKNNQKKIVSVYEEDEKNRVKVLGVKTPETNEEFHPIIADVDAHMLGIKTNKEQILRDTAKKDEMNLLKNDIANLLKGTPLEKETKTYQNLIHPLMGRISAEEHIAYLIINKNCHRDTGIYTIFQHGATTNMQRKEVQEAREEGAPYFPAIEDDTLIAAFLSNNEKVLHLQGKYILPFYSILHKEGGYNFEPQYLWEQQLNELEKEPDIEEIRRRIKAILSELGVTLNQPCYKNIAISTGIGSAAGVAIGILLYSRNYRFFGENLSKTVESGVGGALAGIAAGTATYAALDTQVQTDNSENNKKSWSCNIL